MGFDFVVSVSGHRHPDDGGGFFSANAGGTMAVVASLLGHIVYGAILGAVTGAPAVSIGQERRAA